MRFLLFSFLLLLKRESLSLEDEDFFLLSGSPKIAKIEAERVGLICHFEQDNDEEEFECLWTNSEGKICKQFDGDCQQVPTLVWIQEEEEKCGIGLTEVWEYFIVF